MNATVKESGTRIGESSKRESYVHPGIASESDPRKLTSIIEENRVKLKRGWEELARLTQVLSSLEAPKASVHSKTLISVESTPQLPADPASVIAMGEQAKQGIT
jgi:hypothetical protein